MATDIIARGMITEYIAGTNINFTENRDGTVKISASGSISSEDSVARDAIGNHKSDTSNPHNVTPAQIGLGNVDNTSDLDKPISTAVQKAIDNKADKTVATTTADGLMSAADKTKLDGADNTYALKSKYGDTTINVGRKAGTTVGEYSTAEGINTTASGGRSHAEGSATNALGSNSHSEGRFTTAFGDGSHSEGESIYTIGSSIPNYLSELSTMTNDEIISAWNNIAFSLAKGLNSHSEGYNTLALGNESHAGGSSTIAKGRNSYSGGGNSLAEGSNSFTHGYYTKSSNAYESSFGKCNQSNTDTLFSIGDGTSDSARHNAFEITTTGGKLHDKDIATTDMSLPANGGNADTVGGIQASDIRQITKNTIQTLPTPPTAEGDYFVSNTDSTFPYPYGNLSIRYGSYTAEFVAMYQTTGDDQKMWFNVYCDGWSGWKEISTTPIKSTTFGITTNENGWINTGLPVDTTKIMSVLCSTKSIIGHVWQLDGYSTWCASFYNTAVLSTPLVNTPVSFTIYYIEI